MPTRLLLGTLTALIFAGAVGTVFFQRQAAQHAARAAALERDLTQARAEAAQQRERADKLSAQATELDTHLGNAKTRTTATETKNSQLARELTAAKSSLTERQQREVALLAEIESLRQQIAAASPGSPIPALPASSATVTNDKEPPTTATSTLAVDLDTYRERISILEIQLTDLLTRALAAPSSASAPDAAPPTAPPTVFQVVRVGPHDAFVVIDYGAADGAAVGDELTLGRGTSVVAQVQISDARARFSIAQVLPATLKRQLQTGDFVLIGK